MKHLSRVLTVSALLSITAGVGHAQVTTSGINGTITEKGSKETLIGAKVKAIHQPTGTVYGALTNAKGNFNITGMRPGGPYRIEISYIGYETTTLDNITLSLGESTAINLALSDGAKSLDQVVVTATSKGGKFNAQRTGAASNFSRATIERTPTVSRSIFDIAKLTPQASSSGSGTSFGGSSNKYNSFQIDGAVSNDVFGLSSSGTNGGQTGATPISLEAIDAVQVVIAPFDVRQSGFTGGGINAITKSGTNIFKGSIYDYYRNQDFYGTTPGNQLKAYKGERQKLSKESDNTFGVTLGGPIVKNKLFFFANVEFNKKNTPTSHTIGNGSNITQEEADQVLSKFKSIVGNKYDGSDFAERNLKTDSYKFLTRLDWNINDAHHLTLRYSLLNAEKDIFSNTDKILRMSNLGYTFKNVTNSVVAELNSRFNNTVSNEFRFGYTRIRDSRKVNGTAFPFVSVQIDANKSIQLGQDNHSVYNRLDQDIFTVSDNLTLNLGDHVFTIGTHNEFFSLENLYIPNAYGYYEYRNNNKTGVTGLDKFNAIGTADEAKNLPDVYRYNYAVESITHSPTWAPRFGAGQLGFFAQDEAKISDRFRLTYGLRVDIPLFFDKPTANAEFNNTEFARQHELTNNEMPKTQLLWSPRVGFRYNIDKDRNYTLRGGAGIFTGRIPFVWISNSFTNTGIEYSRVEARNAKDFTDMPGFAFTPDVAGQPKSKYVPSKEVDLVSKNFKFPQVARFNLALDANLPWGIKATLEGMFTQNLNNIVYRNLKYAATGNSLQQGNLHRETYTRLVENKTENGVTDNVFSGFSNIMYLDNTNKGYSYSLTAQLSKDFNFGLYASLAYTYGRSKVVNDGNSSVAYSNWQYNYIFNGGNHDELTYSSHDLEHRLVGTLNYRVAYAKHFATTIGLIYNGQNGPRFTAYYNGDLNGDEARSNDLLYVPTPSEVASMGFTGNTLAAFNKFINDPNIRGYQGNYIPRNALRTPFYHQFDLHFAQDFYFNVAGRKQTIQLIADVENIGNLLNRNWGVSYSAGYGISPVGYSVDKNGVGSYSYKELPSFRDYGTLWSVNEASSRWRAQVGIKYIF